MCSHGFRAAVVYPSFQKRKISGEFEHRPGIAVHAREFPFTKKGQNLPSCLLTFVGSSVASAIVKRSVS